MMGVRAINAHDSRRRRCSKDPLALRWAGYNLYRWTRRMRWDDPRKNVHPWSTEIESAGFHAADQWIRWIEEGPLPLP